MDENLTAIAEELEALLAIYADNNETVTIASQKNIILNLDKKREFSVDFWLPHGYPNQEPPTYRN